MAHHRQREARAVVRDQHQRRQLHHAAIRLGVRHRHGLRRERNRVGGGVWNQRLLACGEEQHDNAGEPGSAHFRRSAFAARQPTPRRRVTAWPPPPRSLRTAPPPPPSRRRPRTRLAWPPPPARLRQFVVLDLRHPPALAANQELRRMVVPMPEFLDAADERRQPLYPVHQALFLQELQRAIHGRRRRRPAPRPQPVQQLVRPGRRPGLQHQAQHLPPQPGQPRAALLAHRLGAIQQPGGVGREPVAHTFSFSRRIRGTR